MKKQVVVIHGGDTFDTYEAYIEFSKGFELDFGRLRAEKWKDSLGEKLGDDFDVFCPEMPCKQNAKYLEWKIRFNKLVPFFEDEVVLVGHSLGGIFLAKYLSEHIVSKKVRAVFLVAAPFIGTKKYSLVDFVLPKSLDTLEHQTGKIFLYQSEDDPVVPFDHLEMYRQKLPRAEVVIFKDRKHFNQPEFPELVEQIRSVFDC